MFYGTDFTVGEFIYKSVIPVTIGNIVAGAFFCALPIWFLYGRHDADHHASNQPDDEERNLKGLGQGKKGDWCDESNATIQAGSVEGQRQDLRRNGSVVGDVSKPVD